MSKLTNSEKDFLLERMFSLLWQTYSEDDWESTLTEAESKKLDKLFDKVDES